MKPDIPKLSVALCASSTSASCAVRTPTGACFENTPGERPLRGSDLVAALQDTLSAADASARDVDEILVDVGPGSYTGLRVATTCARFLARFGARVGTLRTTTSFELIAARTLEDTDTELHILLDARRDRVYHQPLTIEGSTGRIAAIREPAATPLDALDLAPRSDAGKTIAVADASMSERFANDLTQFEDVRGVPTYSASDLFDPRLHLEDVDPTELRPLYLMNSYAE